MKRERSLRVIHGPMEIAGSAGISARGLRELGVHAQAVTAPHRFAIPPDVSLPAGRLARLLRVAPMLAGCDVVHFYYGLSFVFGRFEGADARLLRRGLGKRVVVEFVGDDVRLWSIASQRNPYLDLPPPHDDKHALARIRRWSEITGGHAIVCDHSLDPYLSPYFPHIHIVGQRIDTRRHLPVPPRPDAQRPIIVHAPSDLAIKGTEFVRRAVNQLELEGIPLEYIEIHGMRQAEATAQYARADLIVDQLRLGSHGQFAVEGMSLAKPVVCYIDPHMRATYPPDLPLINASPDTVRDVLRQWLLSPKDRHERGLASRAYVERQHDVRVVARRLMDVYESLPRPRSGA